MGFNPMIYALLALLILQAASQNLTAATAISSRPPWFPTFPSFPPNNGDICARARCGYGTVCRNGRCVDPCIWMKCPANSVCKNGTCVWVKPPQNQNPCATVRCPGGTTCVYGQCIKNQIDFLCFGKICPAGQ